jgi:hypothetical protein
MPKMTANSFLQKDSFQLTNNIRKHDNIIGKNIPTQEFPQNNHETLLMVVV